MRKLATMLLLTITFSMVFAGAVSAQTVDTTVLDEDGNPAVVTCPGDNVTVEVKANDTDGLDIEEPSVQMYIDPETSLKIDPATAVMTYYYLDGTSETFLNDPNDPFFFWDQAKQAYVWWIGWAVPDNSMWSDEAATLWVNGIVTDVGPITVTADLIGWNDDYDDYIVLDTDSYTFLSTCCHGPCVSGKTVPMQNTGTPFAALALGLLSIIGGAVYGKLQ
jgi:hypothetical protein